MKVSLIGLIGLCGLTCCISDSNDNKTQVSIEEYLSNQGLEDQFTQTSTGLYYRIIDTGDSSQFVDSLDILVSDVLLQGLDDRLYYSSESFGPWHRILEESIILTSGMLEAYQLIPIGGRIQALIPYELAYGTAGFSNGGVPGEENLKMEIQHVRKKLSISEYIAQQELGEFLDGGGGLMYKVTEEGTGNAPTNGQVVQVAYTGLFFHSDQPFDQSTSGSPFSFTLGNGQVIEGWDLGIPLFKEGSKGILLIPFELAYGVNGSGNAVPPYENLRFDIEIVSIN